MPSARRLIASLCAVASACALTVPALTLAAPAGPAVASTSPSTTQPLLPGLTTTTTAPPATTAPPTTTPAAPPTTKPGAPPSTAPRSAPTTRPAATTTTTRPAGVPAVPVGAPPTTALPPGTKPAPQPDPSAILLQVDQSLDQLTAISDFKPAQALVAAAESRVTLAGAALLGARQHLQQAQAAQQKAAHGQQVANGQLRAIAVAAYTGVGYSTPGLNEPAAGNGDQGPGTVSTPGGLTGVEAIDAKELLVLVGQRTRRNADDAKVSLTAAMKNTAAATSAYQRAQTTVAGAESNLLAAQQTLKLVTAAAVTPGAAAVTPLPDLVAAARTGIAPPLPDPAATTSTSTAPTSVSAGSGAGGTLTAAPIGGSGPAPTSPTIMGTPVLTGPELAAWYASTGRKANATVAMDQLAADYAKWGKTLDIRDDLAFAQSIVETGYFSFPTGGQLTDKDNNFAGIGACDTCAHGWSFPDASTGVEAQLELLHDYATSGGLPKGVKNVIGGTGVGGCCSTWTKLAGVWASSTVYGISIMTVYERMLTWVIPQREVAVGLIAPTAATPQGPELAPLPGAKTATTATTTANKPAGPRAAATTPVTVSAASAGRTVRSH